ncbi:Efflux transporter, RND family, MFP subunit [uncultured Eubacteriales bacterium]|uniref:Efflux transporter, RND family, MFP subunit n=1 Tax=uncultured Eubacteriales bacterium TaxID=172733 RepID=A0A212JC96_9FIRM|nr:Efflux transporter, RND family, MFP subunit [uncultured Eubacteriales bacterium]
MKRNAFLLPILAFAVLLSACSSAAANTEQPTIGDIQDTVDESGTVYYSENYSITSSVGGRITSSNFDVGALVEAGQVLYTIDDTDIVNKISSAQLNLDSARTSYAQAAKAVEDLSVKSYLSGMITEMYCKVGDYVATGSKVAQVVDSQHLKLKLAFSGTDSIFLGSAAKITVPNDTAEIDGVVTRIYEQTTVFDGRQMGVYVEISFDNPGALTSGETATATVNGISPIATGTIEHVTNDAVYSTGTGLITAVNANVGNNVADGTVVLQIKNDAVTGAVTNASLSISSAEESLKQLRGTLDYYTIKAPATGTILEKNYKESDLATAATPLAILSDGDAVNVVVDIDEKYISKLAVGQSAAVTLTSGADGAAYTGTVKEISDSGTVANGVTYYPVKISLDRQDGLKDGMNVNVSILVASKENCLLVPQSYLVGGSKIEVLEDGKPVLKDVVTGLSDGKYVEIVSGLTETDSMVSK